MSRSGFKPTSGKRSLNPVSLTGALRHVGMWIFTKGNDITYYNPKFKPKEKGDKGIAVYCIHGTGDRASAFNLFANRILPFLPETISSIHLVSFPSRGFGKNIEFFAEQLKNKIQKNNHKKVALIGHSRGGLVASYFAEDLARTIGVEVLSVISICTPFAGSNFAVCPFSWMSSSIKEMAIKSIFLQTLCAKILKSKIKYFYYAAEKDSLLSAESAYLKEHKDSFTMLDRHGHLSILTSHRLVYAIRNQLFDIALDTPFQLLEIKTLTTETKEIIETQVETKIEIEIKPSLTS